MFRTIASSVVSLLLAATLLWGGCISCEHYFMWSGAKKTCCAPEGYCKTKSPAGQNRSAECKQIAFEHQKVVDAAIADGPMMVSEAIELAPRLIQIDSPWIDTWLIEPSPPDLQLLHATFLI